MFDLTQKTPLNTSSVATAVDRHVEGVTTFHDLLPPETGKKVSAKAVSVANFAALYKSKIRAVLVMAAGFLKFFRRGDSANAVMQTVAFLDLMIGGESVPE